MGTKFEKTPGWLDWYTGPSKPKFKVPPGSVDAHCHVFGPGGEFPFAPERKYTPCDASKHQLYALRDHLGFARNVVVQATCHGADNRAMVDCLVHSGGRARGVATVKRSVTDKELAEMHAAGVRGVRFNFVKRLVDFTPKDELMEIAGRISKLGWHVVIYFEAVDLPRAVGLLYRPADHHRRRSHGPPRRNEAGRRAGIRLVREVHGPAPERVVEGLLPRAAIGLGATRARRRKARLS